MPRILCIHGSGTNGELFENSLITLKTRLGNDYEWDFPEGEVECDRAPGIPKQIPGPFLCWYQNFFTPELSAAHELIDDIIEEDGPYDGVVGFSQGASIALSHLLRHELNHPGEKPPFRWALLFSCPTALSDDQAFIRDDVESLSDPEMDSLLEVVKPYLGDEKPANGTNGETNGHANGHTNGHTNGHINGHDASDETTKTGEPTTFFNDKLVDPTFTHFVSKADVRKQALVACIKQTLIGGLEGGFADPHDVSDIIKRRDYTKVPRVFHPALMAERVRVPTVFVSGEAESPGMRKQFALMPKLCAQSKHVIHKGGHDLPKAKPEINEVVEATEWAIEESRMIF